LEYIAFSRQLTFSKGDQMRKQLTQFLKVHLNEVVERHVDGIRQAIPSYSTRTREELRGTITVYIEGIIEHIEHKQDEKLRQFVVDIAQFRSSLEFKLSEVQHAFMIGRSIILQLLIEQRKNGVDSMPLEIMQNIELVNESFDWMIRLFSETYQELQLEKLKATTEALARAAEETKYFRQRQYFFTAVNDSADAIIYLDKDDVIRSWNQGAELIFGYKPQEIITKSFDVLMPEELLRKRELKWIAEQIAEKGFIRNYETERVRKDRTRIAVDLTRTLIRDEKGQVVGSSAVIRDISQRKQMEAKLLQAERLALLGKMAAQVAHEIRNPLSSINLNLELLRDEIREYRQSRQTDETDELLGAIQSEVDRLSLFVDEYLYFVRPPQSDKQPEQINHILDKLLQSLNEELKVKDINITKDFAEDLPEVEIDESQIRRACLNILRNAIEAMPEGGILNVRTKREGNANKILISDTGTGITAEQLEKIFLPFYSTKEMGTGMGLPLVQQILQNHGGTVNCYSVYGKGTTFIIQL